MYIVISGYLNKNLFRYAVYGPEVFWIVPYDFQANRHKILISADRLYLIECGGSIYESDMSNWKLNSKWEIWSSLFVI
ncbi:unnamed protein product [Blepharisma stoltei]|uniref:Uncharacterized protein n=1 Tax=Blepharisma stoltei TaxID=1481888 RepID=A0AAU9JW77_9CILI|nr:unnamed protein product [Blepharisma stoltei]